MQGGRWLAQVAHEIERDREGQGAMAQHGQREVIHDADQSSPAPSRYPLPLLVHGAADLEILAGARPVIDVVIEAETRLHRGRRGAGPTPV